LERAVAVTMLEEISCEAESNPAPCHAQVIILSVGFVSRLDC